MRERIRYYLSLLDPQIAAGYLRVPRRDAGDATQSLRAAIDWLCRAQDAFGDGGVARSYSLAYDAFFGGAAGRRLTPRRPATSFRRSSTMRSRARASELFDRAVRMADWECEVQMAERGGAGRNRQRAADARGVQYGAGDLRVGQGVQGDRHGALSPVGGQGWRFSPVLPGRRRRVAKASLQVRVGDDAVLHLQRAHRVGASPACGRHRDPGVPGRGRPQYRVRPAASSCPTAGSRTIA